VNVDRQQLIDSAQKFAAKGQYDKAIAEYMRVLKEDPTDVRILLKIGDLQIRKGDKSDAIATYTRVAGGYDQQGLFLKAVAVYKQILSIDPNLTDLYTRLADLYVKLNLVPDALAHLDALAVRYARAGQDDRLVGVFRQMVQIDPGNVPTHIKLAELYSKLSRAEDAAREFESGGALLRELGRVDDWAKVAERLLFHRPADVPVAKQLAYYYLERQDAKRALPKLQVAFKANAKDVETLEMLAGAFRELGQLPKTISVLKEVARIHQDAGAQDKRNETYRRVLEIAPNDADAKEALRGASRLSRRPSQQPGPRSVAPAKTQSAKPGANTPSSEPDEIELVEEEEPVYDLANKPGALKSPAAPSHTPVQPIPVVKQAKPVVAFPLASVKAQPPKRQDPQKSIPTPATGQAKIGSIPDKSVSAPALLTNKTNKQEKAAWTAPPTHPDVLRMISEADVFVRYGLKQKAILHLAKALEIDSNAVDVHTRLRDLYIDDGDTDSACRHALRVAQVLSSVDRAAALEEAQKALQIDPNSSSAVELYRRLGGQPLGKSAGGFQDMPTEVGQFPEQIAGQDESSTKDLEEGLDEAEFFITQGLYDEARDTLQVLLASHPSHPLVLDRWDELNALIAAQSAPESESNLDLSQALAENLDAEFAAQARAQHSTAGAQILDLEGDLGGPTLKSSKPGNEAETHYDLGVAYKEMGLLEDAIGKFLIAAQHPHKQCQAEFMIGLCFIERSDPQSSIEHFRKALQSQRTDQEEMRIYFELGNAFEAVNDLSEALVCFQRVEKRDPKFRNSRERVQRLAALINSGTRQQPKPTMPSDIEDVDRAFDELLKG